MKVTETCLPGMLIIEPSVFGDGRGFFLEAFQSGRYRAEAGIDSSFVRHNHFRSVKGGLRGRHFHVDKPQGKLVRAMRGRTLDVAVDITPGSATFGCHETVILSEENEWQLENPSLSDKDAALPTFVQYVSRIRGRSSS